jgi:catechol 2,3-dioxygenase-like lactoylglutathione lyase family enzyme
MQLNQVTVPVTDIEEAITFYERLGLNLIVKSEDYARFICPVGDSTFSVHRVSELPRGDGIWIYFECEDLDKLVQELVDRRILFEELSNNKPWLWREARLKDPFNNQVILYHAGINRKNPPWKIH